MEAPPRFFQYYQKGDVCKFEWALYSLKQSPRVWFGRFTKAMKRYEIPTTIFFKELLLMIKFSLSKENAIVSCCFKEVMSKWFENNGVECCMLILILTKEEIGISFD